MLKNVKISNKLALMLTIPMLGLLYFTIGITWEKQEIMRQMNLSQKLVKLTVKSSALIHELQKERGLSAGFIGSKATKFITKLSKQRQMTDDKIAKLKLLLNNFPFELFDESFKRKLDEVSVAFDEIKTNRQLINKVKISLDTELKFYTNINNLLLTNIRHLSTLVTNAKLANKIVSYVNLLQAKEKAGIERAILNNVFSQGFFPASLYERFTLLVDAQENYTKEFFFFASPIQKQIYHNVINQNQVLLAEFAKIRQIVFSQELKLQLLTKLQTQVGYGGLIHQFKNYVLRGKQDYIDGFRYKYQQTEAIFHKYKNINGISAQDIKNIEIIVATFAEYNKKLDVVIKLKKQHKLAENIDTIVKIDDRAAVKALEHLLKGGNTGISPVYWWELATKRINLLKDIEEQITVDLNNSTNRLKMDAQTTFIFVVLFMIIIILGTFFISYIFVHSITEPLKKLVNIADKISNGERQVQFNVNSKDETGRLSKAMYNMLDSINRSELMLKNTNQAYARFVPNECLYLLDKEHIVEVKMGHNLETDMTILFSDIRSFTTLSEKMSPQENFDFINNYLKIMGPVIRKNGGIIDKYIGDAIMALFDNPNSATEAGIAMLNKLNEFNNTEGQEIKIGIGINTGKLMFGVIGEEHRLQCTVISDAVNLASRLENATKTYGNDLIISNNTLNKLDDPSQYSMRFLDKIKVKGRSEKVNIFEIFDADESQLKQDKQATIKKFEQAVNLYQEYQFSTVQQLMQECLQINSQDKAANTYIQRCQTFLKVEQSEDWEKIAETVKWTSDVAVNHPVIDAQHQELFGLIKDLIMSIGNGNTIEEVETVINFLEDYVITHFTTEENLMQQYNYPDYSEHKAAHELFKKNLQQIKFYYQKKGGSLYLTLRIKDEIVDWLIHHIKKMDQKLALLD
ncbi:bacteriohemerythrin [Candidatus Halobeggiatoa sp. HSG11]|nr:bacteriohemerythrin [Candidatus Halobeggiatoa sp. HSG11]